MFSRQALLWASYDFANSFLIGNIGFYFIQYVVQDLGVPDFYVSLVVVLASALLFLLGPPLGDYHDHFGRRLLTLRLFSVILLASGFLMGTSLNIWLLLAVAFLAYSFVYQLSLVIYNSMLAGLAASASRGRLSGLGEFANWTGYLVGLLATLPIVNGAIPVFGVGRQAVMVPATLMFFVLALPFLLTFREPRQAKPAEAFRFWSVFRKLAASLTDLKKYPGVARFLAVVFFFNNAALTFILFTPLYLEVVGHFSDPQKIFFSTLAFVFAGIGALGGGWLSDRIGARHVLRTVLLVWFVDAILASLAAGFWQFLPLVVIAGLGMGAVWTVMRQLMSELVPLDEQGKFFSLYTMCSRLGAVIGAPLWSLVAVLAAGLGDDRYRASMVALSLLVLVSWFLFRRGHFKNI